MKRFLPTRRTFSDVGFAYMGAAFYAYMEFSISAYALFATGFSSWAVVIGFDIVRLYRERRKVDRTDASPNST